MNPELETSYDTAADDSIGSSQDDVISLPATPTPGGLSRKAPASEKRKKSTPDSARAKATAKRLRSEEKAKRDEMKKQKEEEKQKRNEERRMQQEQRNEAKRKAEEEKQRQNEEKRKQLEEKKKIADEEKRVKLEEKQKRDDEKRQKEDERLKKQEEKRKQMEEKQRQEEEKMRQQEEEKKRKERTSLQFRQFFKKVDVAPAGSPAKTADDKATLAFLPFQLKPNQILVPVVQDFVKERFEIGCFDSLFEGQYESEVLYLKELKSGFRKPIRSGMRVRRSEEGDVVVLDEESKKVKVKLLQFHANTRPAWCGTWNKKSSHVTPRRPFGRDDKWFDYDVDSDDEWEEEEAGESLAGSDNEGEPEDDYEIDNEFMVPHGYLSGEEEENAEEDGGDETNFREKEMIARKNMRVKPLRPVSIGCIWSHQVKLGQHETASDYLKKYQIVFNTPKS